MTTQVLRPILLLAAFAVVLAPVAVVAQVCYMEPDGSKHFVASKGNVPPALRGSACTPAAPAEPPQPAAVEQNPKAAERVRTIDSTCLAGIDRLVTLSGGKLLPASEVRQQLGEECGQQYTAMFEHAAGLLQTCLDAFRSAFDNGDPYRRITHSELMASTRPECRDFVNKAWRETPKR